MEYFYEQEHAVTASSNPMLASNPFQLLVITEMVDQPQASSSTSRNQASIFNLPSQPVDSDIHAETSLAGWQGSNGNGSNQTGGATFNVTIKPRDPPAFHGRATEDVITWLSKVEDFFYLTGATSQQQVAYTATLLLEAAADWWTGLLRANGGQRPRNFQMMSALLKQRFQSSTRADRARAELRFVK